MKRVSAAFVVSTLALIACATAVQGQAAAPLEIFYGFTLIDGLVVARAPFHSSMNYRSVVLFGHGRLIEQADEKVEAMHAFTERLIPGRWDDARQPNEVEIKATSVVAIPIELASAKIRTGPPGDDDEDMALSVWAGVIPIIIAWMH